MATARPAGWPQAPGDVVIRGNGHWRPLIQYAELDTERQRKAFDYLSPDEYHSLRLVKFKGEILDIHEIDGPWPHDKRFSYMSDSFFTGIIVQDLDPDMAQVYDLEPWEWVRIWDYST